MRMLNTGKGPAVRALRAQADKHAYATEMKHTIEKKKNLTLRQGIVEELIVEDGVCRGVVTSTGAAYRSQAVVITAGTALRGEIIIGELKYHQDQTTATFRWFSQSFKRIRFRNRSLLKQERRRE